MPDFDIRFGGGGGGWQSAAVVLAVVLSALYALYLKALPKPLPGIPYNKYAAARLVGDIPEVGAVQEDGGSRRRVWANLARKHKSPIAQFFLLPFGPPVVVVADYQEAHYLMTKRGKDFGRGVINREAWRGTIPEHFIGMEDHDRRMKDGKDLLKDLMTPKFLHEVNAPASYQKVVEFIDLWRQKKDIAQGRPFEALQDLAALTYDIILAAAIGVEDNDDDDNHKVQQAETAAALQMKRLQEGDVPGMLPADKDALFIFPESPIPDLQSALHTIARSAGDAFSSPAKRIWHFFNNRRPAMKRAYHIKRTVLQSYIDDASRRLAEQGDKFKQKSAVDYIVSREVAMAAKAGRKPALDTLRMSDIIFGYLVGGQDSTHSTLSFLCKHLEENQESQKKLRAHLYQSHAEAAARNEQPSLQDILKTSVPYLDAFIQEVLRMSDPTFAISKETLCDMEILGHHVPKNTVVVFNLAGPTYQTPAIPAIESQRRGDAMKKEEQAAGLSDWTKSDFPADKFWPERWLRPAEDGSGEQVYDGAAGPFLAFSAGKRGCWGKKLAYLELKLVVSLMVWNFNFEPLPPALRGWGIEENLFVKPSHSRVRLSSVR